MYIDMKN